MAVQAQCNVPRATRVEGHDTTRSALFLGEPGGGHLLAAAVQQQQLVPTVFSDPRSALTCNNNDRGFFVPRKRARVGDGLIMEGHGGALLPPVPVPVPQAFAAAGDAQSRALCSGAASTSGRTTPAAAPVVSHGLLLSHLYRHSVEADALIRIENERLRAGLQEARRRHVRAAVSALETAAARRLRDAEADLERSLRRTAELEEKLRQMGAEGQAWQGVAKSHEAVAAGLRATLDQLLQSPCAGFAEGEAAMAEDAQSCCGFEQDHRAAGRDGTRVCKACGGADACVLLLPCRHLCLCAGCEPTADACPVCVATKNASLHVLLS